MTACYKSLAIQAEGPTCYFHQINLHKFRLRVRPTNQRPIYVIIYLQHHPKKHSTATLMQAYALSAGSPIIPEPRVATVFDVYNKKY
jgi:hypothetical protein